MANISRWPIRGLKFWPSYIVLRFGLWLMPRGRVRSEYVALLWTWNMRIQTTLAVDQIKEGGAPCSGSNGWQDDGSRE